MEDKRGKVSLKDKNMTREEIRNKIFEYLKQQIKWIETNPNQIQQFQLGNIYSLFPYGSEQGWQHIKIDSIVREIIQELENNGVIYEGQAGGQGDMSNYPWFTITEHGKDVILKEDWLPYDPDGYLKSLKEKVPELDDISFVYIGESISAFNRRHLLSATITLGVASENLMLSLIESYLNWIKNPLRKEKFEKAINNKWISTQYKEFKQEFKLDINQLPKEIQSDWETYLDGIFNFIRLNRNDAGHPTGKEMNAKIVYASLQIFADYARYLYDLIAYLK